MGTEQGKPTVSTFDFYRAKYDAGVGVTNNLFEQVHNIPQTVTVTFNTRAHKIYLLSLVRLPNLQIIA